MKVLIATPYFWPRVGGLEHYAWQTARQLAAHGWEVHVVTSGERTETRAVEGLTVHYLKPAFVISNTPVNPLWRWQLRRLIRALQPDVINVHAPVPSMALDATAAAGRVPVVVTYHAGSMKKGRLGVDQLIGLYEGLLLPRMLQRASRIICASDFVRETFLAPWKHKTVTITPGVDVARFTPDPAKMVPGRLVFIGDFRDPRKGLAVLLEAMKQVPGAHLQVVGEGEGTPQERVTYRGVLRGDALVQELQAAELLVLPSTTEAESFGMVLLEAMACGVAVIGSDVGGVGTLVDDGQTGRLVPPNDAAALARVIRELLQSPSERKRFGKAGRREAEQSFTWEQRGAATDEVLTEAARPRVFLLHNIVAPYRLPVFEAVARHVRLDVYFGMYRTTDRKWDANLTGYHFNYRVLRSVKVGPVVLNPTLLWQLMRKSYDQYLVGDFPEMIFATFTTIAVAKLRRKPVVLWSETTGHEVNYFPHLVTSPKRRHQLLLHALTGATTIYRRRLLKTADRHVALSDMARTFLLSQGIAAEHIDAGIQVMPRELLEAPTQAKSDSPYAGTKLVLYLGYLNHLKGIDRLIRAFRSLNLQDTKLVIAGSGPEEAALRKLAADDPTIVFFGYANSEARANLMSWADVFVLPTLVDCWGMVVNEGLHYGTPVITTTEAGAAELLANGGGIVVDGPDETGLAAALGQILSDAQLHRQLVSDTKRLRGWATDARVGAEPIVQALVKTGGAA